MIASSYFNAAIASASDFKPFRKNRFSTTPGIARKARLRRWKAQAVAGTNADTSLRLRC